MVLKVASLGITVAIDNVPYSSFAYKGLNVYVSLAGSTHYRVNSLSCLCGNLDGNQYNDDPPSSMGWPACEVASNASVFPPSLSCKRVRNKQSADARPGAACSLPLPPGGFEGKQARLQLHLSRKRFILKMGLLFLKTKRCTLRQICV